jgi:DNA repair protein RecO (recombination protein O)
VGSRYITTEAIVLNSIQFGEGHKIISLFTEDNGRLEASAFGVRKTKSRFGGRLEPFTISHMMLYHKDDESPYSIREVEVRFQSSVFAEDYRKYIVANALIESVILFVEKGQAEVDLYRLLADSLKILSGVSTEKSPYLHAMYDIKFLKLMGYTPDIGQCKRCGGEVEEDGVGMDSFHGYPLCKACYARTRMTRIDVAHTSSGVLPGVLRFIRWACEEPIHLSVKVNMEKATLHNLRSVIEKLYLYTFHKKPQSWKQLHVFH